RRHSQSQSGPPATGAASVTRRGGAQRSTPERSGGVDGRGSGGTLGKPADGPPFDWTRVPGPCPPTISVEARGVPRTSDAGLVHREGRATDRRLGGDLMR